MEKLRRLAKADSALSLLRLSRVCKKFVLVDNVYLF
jgi:hypothetical protein